ncbi:hypothetical protein BH23PLA1_BH23PLA1_29390 [soil metagenome]
MNLSVEDYKNLRRDSRWERDLARKLRQLPEKDRLEFLLEFLSVNQLVGLKLARNCLSDRKSFETLLERGLREADASTIRYWLDSVVPRMGFPRVVRRLRNYSQDQAYRAGVKKARYWLTSFSKEPGYTAAKADLEELLQD